MTKIKICGTKDQHDLEIALGCGADAVGFITEVPVESPRKISLEKAADLISRVPLFVTTVLVIMPENLDQAIKMIKTAKPAAVQIHNNVSLEFLTKLKESTNTKIIKTLSIPYNADPDKIANRARELEGIADAILLDSEVGGRTGGTGTTHDWLLSSEIVRKTKTPIILAGGLTPENVEEAIKIVRPYAVDTASGVETDGKKDIRKVRTFVQKASLEL